ncbi:MAG: acylphosphatase [Methanothrix sp.]|nr:acylphosphatase [Methanothrix sp.]
MKLKIKIAGPKTHDVGYRYFLMSVAIDMGLKGFHARNKMGEKEPEVIVLVEGDDESIADFKKIVETRKPERSQVSSIAFEDYEGDVMKTESYAQICSSIQLNKAIPVLLDIRASINDMSANINDMNANINDMNANINDMNANINDMNANINDMNANINDMKASLDEVRKNTAATPQILEEIKDMREDIKPGYGMSMRQVQSDIKAIKEQLGMI